MSGILEALFANGYFTRLDFHFARTMAEMTGESEETALLGAAVASRFTRQGHVSVPIERIAGRAISGEEGLGLGDLRFPPQKKWLESLLKSAIVGDGQRPTPLVLDGGRLYLYRYWEYERRLAAEVKKRWSSNRGGVDERAAAPSLDRLFPCSTEAEFEQRAAAAAALGSKLAVISGGPGTGKTTIVVKLLAAFIESAEFLGLKSPRISMMAPTGKAAARLAEAIGSAKARGAGGVLRCSESTLDAIPENVSTIHRALGFRPDKPTGFRFCPDNPLPADVVIVDEASMVDLALMTKLVEAVPAGATIVLLGDKHQLASVEAGAVFGELAVGPSSVQLTHSYRFGEGSGIGRLARAVNRGSGKEALELLTEGKLPGVEFIEATDSRTVASTVELFAQRRYSGLAGDLEPSEKLALFKEFRMLTAHRRGLDGADGVNALAEELLRGRHPAKDRSEWYEGRPVLVTQNDYQSGLFNGDVGLVCPNEESASGLSVIFDSADGGGRWFAASRLPRVETAFAMTVHKAQGSEFDSTLVILPMKRSPVVTRELVYTALTRARLEVALLCDKGVFAAAVETPTERTSGLSALLAGDSG